MEPIDFISDNRLPLCRVSFSGARRRCWSDMVIPNPLPIHSSNLNAVRRQRHNLRQRYRLFLLENISHRLLRLVNLEAESHRQRLRAHRNRY